MVSGRDVMIPSFLRDICDSISMNYSRRAGVFLCWSKLISWYFTRVQSMAGLMSTYTKRSQIGASVCVGVRTTVICGGTLDKLSVALRIKIQENVARSL